jgi:hypothetical protein
MPHVTLSFGAREKGRFFDGLSRKLLCVRTAKSQQLPAEGWSTAGLYGAILILVIVVAALAGLITVFAHAPGVENARIYVKAL